MTDREDRRAGFVGAVVQVLAWFVVLGISAVLAIAVLVPRVAGATPYVILTGSMRPAMPPGTLVVIKPVPVDEIGIGTVVTYQLESGEPTVVTHRVVSVGINGKGERVLRTQGDANNVVDEKPVLPVQIRGERWYDVPYLGYVTNFVTGGQRQIITVVVASGLLVYAGWMFLAGARDRRTTETSRKEANST